MLYNCNRCNVEVERKRDLKKVRKENLCSECYKKNRINHRKKTIDIAGIKDELRDLNNKYKREKGYLKKSYEEKIGHKPRGYNRRNKENDYIPKRYQKTTTKEQVQESEALIKIKGSNIKGLSKKSNSYLTLEESRDILRILMSRGLTFEEAKKKKEKLIKGLKETRRKQRENNISEESMMTKEDFLKELYNN